jgi:type I restriction enzyme, S subunit
LYTKGGTTGVARAVDLDDIFQIWVHVAVLKLRRELVDPFFLAYVLNSPACYEQSQLFTRGATNQDLGLSRMARIVFPLPPLAEQQRIVRHLDSATALICKAIHLAEREIDLMTVYRTALIAEAVTGRLDVRRAG